MATRFRNTCMNIVCSVGSIKTTLITTQKYSQWIIHQEKSEKKKQLSLCDISEHPPCMCIHVPKACTRHMSALPVCVYMFLEPVHMTNERPPRMCIHVPGACTHDIISRGTESKLKGPLTPVKVCYFFFLIFS